MERHEDNTPTLQGLTEKEVRTRREQYGTNVLTPPERDPWWKLFLEKFDDPIIRILLVAAVIALVSGWFEGSMIEGFGILTAVFLATFVAFINEYKAGKEFDLLNKTSDDAPVTVIRSGDYTTVPRRDLVVGDLVLVETGDEIPADGELVEAVSLQVNESSLTGESVPIRKAPWKERDNREGDHTYPPYNLLRETLVSEGHGTMRVTAVGDSTEIGKTARSASEKTEQDSPLLRQLDRLGRWISIFGFSVAAVTFAALIGRGVVAGEFDLSPGQWFFTAGATAAVLLALARIWFPVVDDAFVLSGRGPTPKPFRTPPSWGASVLGAAALFLAVLLVGRMAGLIPHAPGAWLPAEVALHFLQYFMIVVTIIVVAVPEGLPLSTTLSLAYSMRKMVATNNLVRRMTACETIGAATVICSDKTGTLTMNRMNVRTGRFPESDDGTLPPEVVEGMAVNATANLGTDEEGNPTRLGNPTECALLMALHDRGIGYQPIRNRFTVTKQWTFTTQRKYMATYGVNEAGQKRLHIKGAPEMLLEHCTSIGNGDSQRKLGQEEREGIAGEITSYQARGMRVLGFAIHEGPLDAAGDEDPLKAGLAWLGFVAIEDPVRPEVARSVQQVRQAGIDVKIVTGDHAGTAGEVARQIGLLAEGDDEETLHIKGKDFAALDEEEARRAARQLRIMSRARPSDKLRLVRLLREEGEVVAVTGDGTNDGPALNYASVGLAMGRTGTAVAKEASDIILLDDSFGTIARAVMWGRSLYLNIQRFILFQLTVNLAAVGTAMLGPFLGIELPLTVIQMLWVNLIMDTFAALALATEPPDWRLMENPPRRLRDFIVTPVMQSRLASMGGLFIVATVTFLLVIESDGAVTQRELTLFFTTFVMLQLWNLFNARGLGRKGYSVVGMLGQNRTFLVILGIIFLGQVAIVQFGGAVMRTVPLSLTQWIAVILCTSPVLLLGRLQRWWLTRRAKA
ncbi:MAG: calcium-translocating P-type ATPase, PMCA-type [Synergistales bacterium]|nr:calcium-translocating P-type ATPase, PMCA-type [Synergistales bacterium]